MTKYGKPCEVANAHVQNIISLPQINNANAQKINYFSEKLLRSVQALDIMEKMKEIDGYVRVTLDKLRSIRTNLVGNDDNWQDWKISTISRGLREVDCKKSYTIE